MRLVSMRGLLRGVAVLTVAAVLLFSGAMSASAIVTAQGVDGTLKDSLTSALIKGVVVSAYDSADDSYVSSTVSDASGSYSLWLPAGKSYKIQYRDPQDRYGENWSGGWPDIQDAEALGPVNASTWIHQPRFLAKGGTVKVVVTRANHPLTVLPGKWVVEEQKAAITLTMTQWWATTGGDGSATFSGLSAGNAGTYKESVVDPIGQFLAADANTWRSVNPYNGTTVVNASLFVAGPSFEVTPTVPYAKHSQKKNKSFTASGKFSKSVANGSQIQVLAIKGSTRKTFGGKIKSSKYYVKVKLPKKGTWTLYALFKGNSTFAPNDSLNGKSIKAN